MLATRFTGFVALAMLLALGLAALTLLAQIDMAAVAWQSQPAARDLPAQAGVAAIEGQIIIAEGLKIREHAAKHNDETLNAWIIYGQLLAGKCAASTVFCGGSEIEKLYLCIDPVSGLVGGLLVFGDEIMTGYGSHATYWERVVERDNWEICHD